MMDKEYYNEIEYLNEQINSNKKVKESWFKRLKIGSIAMLLAFGLVCGGSSAYFVSQYYQTNNPTAVVSNQNTYIPTITTNNGSEYTYAQVAAMVSESVVEIVTETVTNNSYIGQYVSSGAGSGVVISSDGYIVTNNHVIEGATNITVRLTNGEEYNAKLIATDSRTDIAVIKIEAKNLKAATIGNSDNLAVGDEVLAIGNPLGELGGSVTNGIISAKDRVIEVDNVEMTLLQTTAAINPGNSGGGLFNLKGELIGVVNAKSSGTGIEGLGFAIPSNIASSVINDLVEFGYVKGRVMLGINAVAITDSYTAMRYGVTSLGVLVHSVTNNNSSLQANDLITEIEGEAITSLSSITKALNNRSIGDVINVKVIRNGVYETVKVTLQEYVPAN